MKNRLPKLFSGSKICIICEGDEEYEHLDKLISLNVWSNKFQFTLENACGNRDIPARYQDKYQNGSYDIVLIFCHTDKKTYEQYADIKHKINEFHGADDAAEHVIIFGNSCTIQIIIEHWEEIAADSNAKKHNDLIISKLTEIEKKKGQTEQRQELCSKITKENYNDDIFIGNNNFGKFMEWFSSDNEEWVQEINRALD